MKIYPGNHTIKNVEKIDMNRDIQLGYFDSDFLENKVDIIIENDFKKDIKEKIIPYSYKTNSLDISLYDKNMNKVSNIDNLFTKLSNNNYQYVPYNSYTFVPKKFNYKIIAKKTMAYSSKNKYNIKVKCENEELANKLIYLFADSFERKICPMNIKFNNGDKKINSLINNEKPEIQFLITECAEDDIDINYYLNNNIIPIIFCDKINDKNSCIKKDKVDFNIKNNIIIKTNKFETDAYFNSQSDLNYEIGNKKYGVIYHKIFNNEKYSPIIIKEIVNKGFIIYCTTNMIDIFLKEYNIFYETIMYIYLNSYLITDEITEWLTDIMPDYIVKNKKLIQKDKFTSSIELYKIFGLNEDEIKPVGVEIEEDFVYKITTQKKENYNKNNKYNIGIGYLNNISKNNIENILKSKESHLENISIDYYDISENSPNINFIFIESEIGDIDIDYYINNNMIPVIFCDKIKKDDQNCENNIEKTFEINGNIINNKNINTKYYFNTQFNNSYISEKKEYYINYDMFFNEADESPIIIKEIINKGFIIYCNKNIENILENNNDILYELLIKIYLKSYKTTNDIRTLKLNTDIEIDNNDITTKEKVFELLNLIDKSEIIIDVETEGETPIAACTSISNNYITFKKIYRKAFADPIKKENQISIYTEKDNIMFFDNFIYHIQDSMINKINSNIIDNTLYITIDSFKNSSLNATINNKITLYKEIDNNNEFKLVWNKNLKLLEIVNELKDNYILIATFKVIRERKEYKLYDMRQRGGGLPKTKEDNFDCFDIGNILGRPYRKGGTLVTKINIPKKYEYNKDKIYKIIHEELSKNMIADDLLILKLNFI